jgi:hypothetical protein
MRVTVALVLIVAASVGVRGTEPLVRLGAPEVWAHLDVDRLKGRPAQLAWSDDEDALYLQTVEGTTASSLKIHHYLLVKEREPAPLERMPLWAQAYWKWKSAKHYFGDPLTTIEVDRRRETIEAIRDRNTAYLNSDAYAPATLESKATDGWRVVNRLLFKGQILGEFVDEEIFPGYTFSWSPESLAFIAFRARNGHLTIMNLEGETQAVDGEKDIWLPAWSPSGQRLAYLDRDGRKRFVLKVIPI